MVWRNAAILVSVLAGNLCLVRAVAEDSQAAWMVAGLAWYLGAYVYAQLTKPRS